MSAEATRLPGGSQQSADVAEPSGCCPALDTLQHLWLEIHRHNLATLAYGLGDGKRQAAGAAAHVEHLHSGLQLQPANKAIRLGSGEGIVEQPALSGWERNWVFAICCHPPNVVWILARLFI
jgi:hypothetical protein